MVEAKTHCYAQRQKQQQKTRQLGGIRGIPITRRGLAITFLVSSKTFPGIGSVLQDYNVSLQKVNAIMSLYRRIC